MIKTNLHEELLPERIGSEYPCSVVVLDTMTETTVDLSMLETFDTWMYSGLNIKAYGGSSSLVATVDNLNIPGRGSTYSIVLVDEKDTEQPVFMVFIFPEGRNDKADQVLSDIQSEFAQWNNLLN